MCNGRNGNTVTNKVYQTLSDTSCGLLGVIGCVVHGHIFHWCMIPTHAHIHQMPLHGALRPIELDRCG